MMLDQWGRYPSNQVWRKVREDLGVPDVTSHSFRKSLATLNHPTTCGKVCEDLWPMLHRIGLTPVKV